MKAVLIILGTLGGLYAVVGIVLFVQSLLTNDPGNAYGGSEIAASVVPPCIGLIVCLACFQAAIRKPKR